MVAWPIVRLAPNPEKVIGALDLTLLNPGETKDRVGSRSVGIMSRSRSEPFKGPDSLKPEGTGNCNDLSPEIMAVGSSGPLDFPVAVSAILSVCREGLCSCAAAGMDGLRIGLKVGA